MGPEIGCQDFAEHPLTPWGKTSGSLGALQCNLASLLDMAAGMSRVSVWHLWGLWLWRHISTKHPLSSSQMGHLCSEGDIRLEKQTLEMRD